MSADEELDRTMNRQVRIAGLSIALIIASYEDDATSKIVDFVKEKVGGNDYDDERIRKFFVDMAERAA